MASLPFPAWRGILSWKGWQERWPSLLFMVALPIGIYGRIVSGWRLPLWFDETFSGTIAGQPRFIDLIIWCRHELTGPGFYMPLWAWARIAGTSDAALRLPSVACSIATPLILARFGDPDRRLRLFWAILVLFWTPSLVTATEARPYAQLFLLGSLQAIAFLHLMRSPSIPRALAWSVTTATMGLTHYHAVVIGACEGLAFLVTFRGRTITCWPALVPFLPLLGWMALHLPFVLAFGAHHDAIYASLADVLLPSISPTLRIPLLVGPIIAVAALGAWTVRRADSPGLAALTPELMLAGCGMAAILLEIIIGLFHSGFMSRYLTPSIPPALYGCAIWIRKMERSDGGLVCGVFGIMIAPFAFALDTAVVRPALDDRHLFNFEIASAWLAESRPDRLTFLWSDGAASISGDRQVGEVAGFFLHRAGLKTTVTVVHPSEDPGQALHAAAGDDPRGEILWVAGDGRRLSDTASRILQGDGQWTCRDFGDRSVTVTGCRHRQRPSRSASGAT